MQMDRALKLSVTGSVIVFLVVSSIVPNVVASSHTDQSDGVYTDDFTDTSGITFINHTIGKGAVFDNTTQSIHMGKNQKATPYDYTFASGSYHKAFAKRTLFPFTRFFLFSPARLGAARNEFVGRDISALETKGGTTPTYAWRPSENLHYFRFQLNGPADTLGNLTVTWYGAAVNAQRIEVYYWHHRIGFSGWEYLASNTKLADVYQQIVSNPLDEATLAQALDDNNFIDICVVARGRPFAACTLYSDFIDLESAIKGLYHTGYAYVQTKSIINLTANSGYWELLTWKDNTPVGTNITYQLLYNNQGTFVPIADTILNGNIEGFSTPPISLAKLGNYYTNIKVQANLSTSDPTVTPSLYNWTVIWQTSNQWQDHFHTDLRVAEKDNVNVNYGNVTINLVRGDWPMFGQNPRNTRASTGSAALTGDSYWFSDYFDPRQNETPASMILDGQALYVASQFKNSSGLGLSGLGRIIRYSKIDVPASNIGDEYSTNNDPPYEIQAFDNFSGFHRDVVNSPAISGRFLVVATGEIGVPNYVLAYDKDDLTHQWTYFNSASLCYWGSPTIANGFVYVTAWSGDESLEGYQTHNMLIALDLNTGAQKWSYAFPSDSVGYYPNWSYSTPAYANGTIVVGCMNELNDSLFALDAETGTKLWNTTVGSIGKAAPVIYGDTVYVVSENNTVPLFFPRLHIFKRTQPTLSAVYLSNGTIRWQTLLGNKKYSRWNHILDPTFSYAETTPVIVNGVLYVVSPDWNVSAFDVSKDGERLWSVPVPGRPLLRPPLLFSSPAYSGGYLYITTPTGVLEALNTATQEFVWHYSTKLLSTITNPIASNGLVFIGDYSGEVNALGNYFIPTTEVNGTVISKSIQLPEGYWWKSFFALTNETKGVNHITFSLLDTQNNLIKAITSGEPVAVSNATLGRSLRLQAALWAKNGSVNPKLLSWNITFIKDVKSPVIYLKTLVPKLNLTTWVNKIIPQFSIKVQDNETGLQVNSARYTLTYVAHNQTQPPVTNSATCSGSNGTTDIQTMTVNLTSLEDYANITAYRTLNFSISDLAGNPAVLRLTFKEDTQPPYSFITSTVKKRYNATRSYIYINATAKDNKTSASDASNVSKVDLYYRYSTTGNFSGSWIFFASNSTDHPRWKFGFTNNPSQNGGYFQLATKAYDNAGNNESLPAAGDVSFLYDWTLPDIPVFGETHWFNEQPRFSVTFTDDYQLATVQYRPNFDTTWITIASDINKSSYPATWQLDTADWQKVNSGHIYYLYFRITDALGNTRNISSASEALSFGRDEGTTLNVVTEVPPGQNHVITSGNFTVSASVNDNNGSGVSEVALYYQYSKDNRTWSDWTLFDTNLSEAPYAWAFTSPDGDGYYRFQTVVVDHAGNQAQSEVVPRQVVRLPTSTVMLMYGLVIVILLIGAVLFIRWRKRA